MADEQEDFPMQSVVSSQIASVGYSPSTKELRVRFSKNGSLYSYSGVESEVYDRLISAPSVGQFFSAVIKSGPYPYTRLE